MSTYRYSRWDGSQELAPFDADDVLRALSEDVLAEGDVRRALQRLMQRGMRGARGGDIPGLRRILEQLRRRRQAELERSNLDSVLGDLEERLGLIIDQEREGIERRFRLTEEGDAIGAGKQLDRDAEVALGRVPAQLDTPFIDENAIVRIVRVAERDETV